VSDISINLFGPGLVLIAFCELVLCVFMIGSFAFGSKLGYFVTMPFLVILMILQISLALHL
jgi:hypothetical protein